MLLPRGGAGPAGEGGVHGVQLRGGEEAQQQPPLGGGRQLRVQLQGHEDDVNLQVRHVSGV